MFITLKGVDVSLGVGHILCTFILRQICFIWASKHMPNQRQRKKQATYKENTQVKRISYS